MSLYPLLEQYPELALVLPVAGLLRAATPVQVLDADRHVYLKRDDLSASDYGGNKIRKLDFLLAGARRRGARELLTFGYAGSNFVAATAWHGRKLGLDTFAYLLPQVHANYVGDNLAVALHAGAALHVGAGTAQLATAAALRSMAGLLRHGRWPFWIPPGGSSPPGVAGFINAALELREQVKNGELPAPEWIYVAFSSMGTVAGLALGLELAGLPSRIMAVQVVDRRFAGTKGLAGLMQRSCRVLGKHAPALRGLAQPALRRVRIRTEFFGEGYAMPTAQTLDAIERFSTATGARADSAYSGKALACLYQDMERAAMRGPLLFWHTFNAHGLPAGVRHPQLQGLPAELRGYFKPRVSG